MLNPIHCTCLPKTALVAAIALGLLVGCEHSEQPDLRDDLATMPLRDVYGVDPSWLHDLPQDTQNALRTRTLERAQATDTGTPDPWVDPKATTSPTPLPAPYNVTPTDPASSTLRYDLHLQQIEHGPVPFVLYTHSEHGTQPFPCAPTLEELQPTPSTHLPTLWTSHLPSEHTDDQNALRSLSDGLERWRTRCLNSLDFPEAAAALHVHPQPQAPYLVAYWPQRHSLFINPVLFSLWGLHDNPPPTSLQTSAHTQTRGAALTTFDNINDCISHFRDKCNLCTREYATQNPTECPPIDLFDGSPIHEDCQTLRFDLVDGFLKLCVQDFLLRPSVKACFESDTTASLCQLPPANTRILSPSDLSQYYSPFSDGSSGTVCRDTLDTCIANPEPTVGTEQPPPPLCDPWEPSTFEGQMWSFCLNDTYCNDLGGILTGGDLCYYDPKRPKLNVVLCDEQQPSDCCGEQGDYPDYERENCRIE